MGITHLLNDCDIGFDPSREFDATLVMVLCSIIVRNAIGR